MAFLFHVFGFNVKSFAIAFLFFYFLFFLPVAAVGRTAKSFLLLFHHSLLKMMWPGSDCFHWTQREYFHQGCFYCLWPPHISGWWRTIGAPTRWSHMTLSSPGSCEITSQTNTIISPIPECLWSPNLTEWASTQ